MLMMKIEMNADKIQAEQRYTMSAINRTIESAFVTQKVESLCICPDAATQSGRCLRCFTLP